MTVLGVGADYGLYTISLAKEMPNQGHTWSFEPTSPSARHLGQSIKELAQITVRDLCITQQKPKNFVKMGHAKAFHHPV